LAIHPWTEVHGYLHQVAPRPGSCDFHSSDTRNPVAAQFHSTENSEVPVISRTRTRETWRRLSIGLAPPVFLVAALCGCATSRPPEALPEPLRQAIRARVNDRLAGALFFKPAEAGATNSPAFRFAPLILQEVAEGGTNHSAAAVTKVYFHEDRVQIRGRWHDQFSYLWRYDAAAEPALAPGLPMQGIRITLDLEGEPAVWEVLADTLGAQILCVSEPLEDAAKARFRKPRPGRRFVSERDLRETPMTVVAQAIPEGPTPMGPIIHLRAGTHDVGAVICRCMPSQVERLAGQGLYQLVADDRIAWVFEAQCPNRLEEVLRLPGRF
jgi:hypothetical protein